MFIELGIINCKLLIPFMYPLFYQIRKYIHKDSNPFYILFTDYFGYLFGGIILLIIKFRMRKINKKKENNEEKKEKEIITLDDSIDSSKNSTNRKKSILVNQIEVEKKKIKIQKLKHKYCFLLLLSFINMIPMPLEIITDDDINIDFKLGSSLFYHIFFFVFFSRIILGIKIYRHQIFSLIIIILCIPILLTFYLINDKEEKKYSNLIQDSFYLIIIICLYSLYDILGKKYYNTYMDSPYHLMFVIGAISLFILIPYEIITVLIYGVADNSYNGIIYQIKTYYKDYNYWYPFIFILDVITKFLWVGGIILTIYFFTPCHFIISESLSQIVSTIVENSLKKYDNSLKIIIFTLYFIIVFSSLIYNEVIIINVFSLSKDTKKKIYARELVDKDMKLNLLEYEMDERTTVYSNN